MKSTNKKNNNTAVDQFYEAVKSVSPELAQELLIPYLNAKFVEKNQIINAATIPRADRWYDAKKYRNCGEQHYDEKYGTTNINYFQNGNS